MSADLYQEIKEAQRKSKSFRETELGALFEKFVNLHGKAWSYDERYSGSGPSVKAWDALAPVEKELREKLMQIAGVE